MTKLPFGRTGFDVAPLGFGAAPAAFLKPERDRAVQVINLLLDNGVNLIDTAAMYPGSEEFLGQNFAHRRNDFLLVTKCGTKIPESTAQAWTKELITETVDRALRLLRTDHLDVMLLHSCDLATLQKGDAWGALQEAQRAGKTRFIGYSGDNEAADFATTLPGMSVIQTSVSIVDQANIDRVLPKTREKNIAVLAKRPVANAAWKDPATLSGIYVNYVKPYIERFNAMGLSHRDLGFSGTPDEAWPEIALRFTLAQPGVNCAIIGTTSPDNARRNLALAAKGPLDARLVQLIREAFRKSDPGGKWPGLT